MIEEDLDRLLEKENLDPETKRAALGHYTRKGLEREMDYIRIIPGVVMLVLSLGVLFYVLPSKKRPQTQNPVQIQQVEYITSNTLTLEPQYFRTETSYN